MLFLSIHTYIGIELLLWLSKHLNQCVLLSMELHWTLVLHFALTSDLPVEQLRLARYLCAMYTASYIHSAFLATYH